MDKLRIYWVKCIIGEHTVYYAMARMDHFNDDITLFAEYDRDAFFRRYNALTVEKEVPVDA